jgi:hypothetical protein
VLAERQSDEPNDLLIGIADRKSELAVQTNPRWTNHRLDRQSRRLGRFHGNAFPIRADHWKPHQKDGPQSHGSGRAKRDLLYRRWVFARELPVVKKAPSSTQYSRAADNRHSNT